MSTRSYTSDVAGEVNNSSSDSTAFQKIFTAEAPPINWLGGAKGPTELIVLPPHHSYTQLTSLTGGSFVNDPVGDGGMMPTLGDYAADWLYVYKQIGTARKLTILAVNFVEDENGNEALQVEQQWGKRYKSPMYKLQEWLWTASGKIKFDKKARQNIATGAVLHPKAIELLPPGQAIGAPMSRGQRTLFLQGLLVQNAGISYLEDQETKQPVWPQHRIMMINQATAIKYKENSQEKMGFYDIWLKPRDGVKLDPAFINDKYGNVLEDLNARRAWERETFINADFSEVSKVVKFETYATGGAGILNYKCTPAVPLAQRFGQAYQLPEQVKMQIRPIWDFVVKSTEADQIVWLQEAFSDNLWALEGAGIIPASQKMYAMPTQTMPAQYPAPAAMPPQTPYPAPAPPAPFAPTGVYNAPQVQMQPSQVAVAPGLPTYPTISPNVPTSAPSVNIGQGYPQPPAMPDNAMAKQMQDMINKMSAGR